MDLHSSTDSHVAVDFCAVVVDTRIRLIEVYDIINQ